MRYIVHVKDNDTNELHILGARVPFLVKGHNVVLTLGDVEESFIPLEVSLVENASIMVQCEDDQFHEFTIVGIYDGKPLAYVEL